MSQSLMDLIVAYGSARATWMAGGNNHVPETLAAIEARIEAIEDAALHGESIVWLLDGTE